MPNSTLGQGQEPFFFVLFSRAETMRVRVGWSSACQIAAALCVSRRDSVHGIVTKAVGMVAESQCEWSTWAVRDILRQFFEWAAKALVCFVDFAVAMLILATQCGEMQEVPQIVA